MVFRCDFGTHQVEPPACRDAAVAIFKDFLGDTFGCVYGGEVRE